MADIGVVYLTKVQISQQIVTSCFLLFFPAHAVFVRAHGAGMAGWVREVLLACVVADEAFGGAAAYGAEVGGFVRFHAAVGAGSVDAF